MTDEIIQPRDFSIFEDMAHVKRASCPRCQRPEPVCLCSYAVQKPIETQTNIIILKHPSEEKRSLTTVPLLQLGLSEESCHVFVGNSFLVDRPRKLDEIVGSHTCYVVYPCREAVPIESVIDKSSESNNTKSAFIFLDASWKKAKGLYNKNLPWLKQFTFVMLQSQNLSQYVIRTQPTDTCVSTLEATALVLHIMEKEKCPDILEKLLAPLRALCQFQIDHGAQKHDSKQRKKDLLENQTLGS